MMRRLWEASIWHKDAWTMQRVQERFRPLLRIGLPVFDGLLILFSIFGVIFGSNAVREFTLWWFNPLFSAAIGLSAALALFGLVFQHQRIELQAKSLLVVCLAVYTVFLIASATIRTGSAALTAALSAAAVAIITLRIFDLVGQIALEEAE